jgi:hypothetical protein
VVTYSAPHTENNLRNNPRSRYAKLLPCTPGMAMVLLVGMLLAVMFGGPDRGPAAEARGTGSPYAAVGNSIEGALPAWGADHAVNPTPVFTPSAMRNSAVAGNPADPQKLIAGYENTGIKLNETDYASSSDAGRTWVTGAFTASWGMRDYIPFGDVNVAYDGRGTGYFTTLAISNTASLLVVLTTTDSLHWGPPASSLFRRTRNIDRSPAWQWISARAVSMQAALTCSTSSPT